LRDQDDTINIGKRFETRAYCVLSIEREEFIEPKVLTGST